MKIIFADEHIVVANKPGGLLSVPGRGPEKQDCLSTRLRRIYLDMPEQPAVHRLDMATSGLLVFARTKAAHRNLSSQFERREVEKFYEAVVEGFVPQETGEIRLAFRLDVENRPLQIYDPERGKPGITRWQRLTVQARTTRLRLQPLTGRTHQLRLHCAHHLGLNCPIVGDFFYGNGEDGTPMLLHATDLAFHHPQNGEWLQFHSPATF